jgi:AraC-like DNA-binding protein
MQQWSLFRDADLGKNSEAAIRLADLLSSSDAFSSADDGASIFPNAELEVFARGRYRAQTIRPLMQYIDCDLEMASARRIKGHYAPSLCIGLLLKGAWTSVINGKPLDTRSVGIPMMLGAGEPFEAVSSQIVGQRCRMAALYVSADFFETVAEDDEASFDVLPKLLKRGLCHQEFPRCGILKSILQRLYDNPYQGAMGRLYAESLALSAIVELGIHLRGSCNHRTILRSHHDQAYEVREILDRDIGAMPAMSDLARRVGTSEVTLRRLFKATFGTTIVQYVRNRRLDAARVMLREGRLQVAEVAYRVGYANPPNFTAAYKRRFGYPPIIEMENFKV